jgi:hypothetical protein
MVKHNGGLSPTLLVILNDVKEQKQYKMGNRHDMRFHEDGLFNVMYLYLKAQNVLSKPFKAKHFNQKNQRVYGHTPRYIDCPLSPGEVWSAIKYGNKEGLIENIGNKRNRRWVFTEKMIEVME